MNKDQVLAGLYTYLTENLPQAALSLIIQNDIRVENFFAIHSGVYLNSLLPDNQILSFLFQHTILLENPQRIHIDIVFTDLDNCVTYLELKHFSISQNRGNGRRLSFYTSNTVEGRKVGIVGDCVKFNILRNNGYINDTINMVCCAFITPKPTQQQINNMTVCFQQYPELVGWELDYPMPLGLQSQTLGMMTLQKQAVLVHH
ncbi:hypothetical protein [Spirosoma rigui]|uniref:hypothetical protein n=1 Tax=Spirosoma rigui TaxID=564064 RepID=UPI0009B07C1E|nr:hypothetical protein [Spirosoma rigui]